MSEAMNLDQAENIVLNYLAEKDDKKSPSELQEALGLNRVIITRVLRNAKNRKPAMVSLDGGKYRFVGNKGALSPIPEDVKVDLGIEGSEPSESKVSGATSASIGMDPETLGPIDRQILELLTTRKKFPQSGLMKQFNLEEDEAEAILSGLEENELVISEHLEAFDENSFSLTEKGKAMVEAMFDSEQPSLEPEASEQASEPSQGETVPQDELTEEKGPMVSSGRTFEIPSFDDIPEENSSGRGRPTGDRDFEKLHVYILAYIQEKQPIAKSNISRTLAKVLSNFGRQTIVEEIDRLVSLGYVEEHTIGKREMFSLSSKGSGTIKDISKGNPVQPIVKGQKAPEPKKAVSTEKARPSAPAATAKPAMAKAETTEAVGKTQSTKAEPSAPREAPSIERSAPSAPVTPSAQAISAEGDNVQEIKGKIEALLRDIPGEKGFELRQYFHELSQRIRALEKSKSELSELVQKLVTKI